MGRHLRTLPCRTGRPLRSIQRDRRLRAIQHLTDSCLLTIRRRRMDRRLCTLRHRRMSRRRRGAVLADGLGRIGTLAPSAIRGVNIWASSFAS
jgi:hypothetical protein